MRGAASEEFVTSRSAGGNMRRLCVWLAALTLASVTGQTAFAQSVVQAGNGNPPAQADSTAGSAEDHPGGLSEIVVTAQKRAQNLQDVPISISAVTGDALTRQGVDSISALARAVPGVLISEFAATPSNTSINIRGVAQLDYSDHQESPNAVYVDGAYISFQGATALALYDIDHLEVLRGPQGTLYGRNATGGLIHVITRKPTDTTEGYFELQYGSYNQFKTEGAFGGALAPGLSGRVSFTTNRQDGYIRNNVGKDYGSDQTYNGRVQLQWKPAPDIENLLSIYGTKTPRITSGIYDIFPTALDPDNHDFAVETNGPLFGSLCESLGFPTPPAGSTNCTGYSEPDDGPYRVSAGHDGSFKRGLFGLTNTLEVGLGDAKLTWVSNFIKLDKHLQENNSSTPTDLAIYSANQDSRQFSQELRLSGESDLFRWVIGGYYLKITGDYDHQVSLGAPFGFAAGSDFTQKVETYSVFGQIEYDIAPELTMIAGGRWTEDKKKLRLSGICSLDVDTCRAIGFLGGGDTVRGSYSKGDWSGKLQVSWKPADDVMLYTGVNRGIKGSLLLAPTLASVATTFESLIVKPEILTTYEGGFKLTSANRMFRLNGSVFYYVYKNFQAYKFENLSSVIFNADARNYGAELEAEAALSDTFHVNVGLALLKTKIKDVSLPDGSITDQQSAYAPKVSVNATVRKEFPTDAGTFSAQGTLVYVGSRYFSTVNEPALRAPGYVTGDLAFGFTSPDEHWNARLTFKNANDRAYSIYRAQLATVAGYGIQNVAPPRWFTFSVGYNF